MRETLDAAHCWLGADLVVNDLSGADDKSGKPGGGHVHLLNELYEMKKIKAVQFLLLLVWCFDCISLHLSNLLLLS